MSRKSISFKVAAEAVEPQEAAEEPGSREAWIAAGAPLPDLQAGTPALAAPDSADSPEPASSPAGAVSLLLFPATVASCCLSIAKGFEEIGQVWSESALESASRSSQGAIRAMQCWTPLEAALLQRDLASKSLSEAFAATARMARITERVSREAAGISRG